MKALLRRAIDIINPGFTQRHWDRQMFAKLNRRPPELLWEPQRQGPYLRQDTAGIRVRNTWYIFGGFYSEDEVIDYADVFDFEKNRWVKSLKFPDGTPQTHTGVGLEGDRWIYLVGGQLGARCSPAVAKACALDTLTDKWADLPGLPKPRYAPVVQFWKGRLHAAGGSKEDRWTPSLEHYSIGVKDGKATESHWKREADIPRGGPHRGSAIINDKFYLIGGQEGDFARKDGDPLCGCTDPVKPEVIYPDVYMLAEPGADWQRKADMPVKNSHLEFSTVVMGSYAVTCGGMHEKHPDTKVITMSDAVQVYDAVNDKWTVVGRLPYCTKGGAAAFYNGYLYYTTGQKEKAPGDPRPDWYDDRVWRAKFDLQHLLTLHG